MSQQHKQDLQNTFTQMWADELQALHIVDAPLPGDKDELEKMVDAQPPITALCLSGGGIRSASFALGVLQALAGLGLLDKFKYLSTVSGGGYIGGWLSAWRLACGNDRQVFSRLNALSNTGAEPAEIAGIRADSNYLTPQLGLFSADTWTLMALYIRNLMLNWILFVPLLLGLILIPRVSYSVLTWSNGVPADGFTHAYFIHAFSLGGALALCFGLVIAVYGRFASRDQWLSRKRFVRAVLPTFVISAVCFLIAATAAHSSLQHPHGWGAVAGMLIYGVAWLLAQLLLAPKRIGSRLWDCVAWSAAGAMVGLLIITLIESVWKWLTAALVAFGLSAVVLAYLIGELLYVGLSSFERRGDADREWLARSSGWLSAIALVWAGVSVAALYGPMLVEQLWQWLLGIGGIAGVMTLVLGGSGKTAATLAKAAAKELTLLQVVSVAAAVFAIALIVFMSWVDVKLATLLQEALPTLSPVYLTTGASAILILMSYVISLFVNVNRFSLHALYRNRLVRAFLGSARGASRNDADPFTGFSLADNPKMMALAPMQTASLFHVVNIALNVVASDNPAWQERKAESFTVTPRMCGNPYVGYRPTREYGDRDGGISLGTAMAISGAAVSPNQGYNSSPLISFLLMLFNVRLGWWLGNPRVAGVYRREGPGVGIVPALKELAGATTDKDNWIYLSDGGHFENLGIYEMIRRRCRFIVVSDAGCDDQCTFEDLGNAARKVFVDFGVSIDFDRLDIKQRSTPPCKGVRCAIGTIKYPGSAQLGCLIYIKPTYCGDEAPPIRSYAATSPTFPHESTADQWFSESQLEAYRALGAHTIEAIASHAGHDGGATSLDEFKDAANRYVDANKTCV